MRNRRRFNRGVWAVNFGFGLFVATVCPSRFVMLVLAVLIVCLGISCTKY